MFRFFCPSINLFLNEIILTDDSHFTLFFKSCFIIYLIILSCKTLTLFLKAQSKLNIRMWLRRQWGCCCRDALERHGKWSCCSVTDNTRINWSAYILDISQSGGWTCIRSGQTEHAPHTTSPSLMSVWFGTTNWTKTQSYDTSNNDILG